MKEENRSDVGKMLKSFGRSRMEFIATNNSKTPN